MNRHSARIAALLLAVLLPALTLASCAGRKPARPADNYRNYYEIFVRSFYDSNGDGLGDLPGVTAKLGYITENVGADGIWLMPIMPSPTYHKYDVTDYRAIDPEYGTLADFDQLVAAAHRRGVKLIIDLVVNHTSNLHPWFAAAVAALWAGQDSPYIGYYNFTTGNPGQGFSKITDKYYYESRFVSSMPDLNLDNPAVREEIRQIMQFWLDRGVDGFRLDAVTSYYTGNTTKCIEFLSWLGQAARTIKPDAWLIGEAWSDGGTIADFYQSGIDSFFNFPYAEPTGLLTQTLNGPAGKDFATGLADWQRQIAANNPKAQNALFLSNHDMARSAGFLMRSLVKEKMAAALYLLAPGSPFIYYGEELGMTGSGIDENKRLPMFWSAADPAGIPWPPPKATQSIEGIAGADSQITDPDSLLNYYRRILAIKTRYPGIARGTPAAADAGSQNVAALAMTYQGKTVYVLHNLTGDPQTVAWAALAGRKLKLADFLATGAGTPSIDSQAVILPPLSTVILE